MKGLCTELWVGLGNAAKNGMGSGMSEDRAFTLPLNL